MKKVALEMLKHYKGINVGEIAGYEPGLADKLVKAGVGKYYNKKEVKKEASHSSEAKIMVNVEDLMGGKIEDIKKELETKTFEDTYLYPVEYLEEALDFESLNKGREGMLEYLMTEMEDRNAPAE